MYRIEVQRCAAAVWPEIGRSYALTFCGEDLRTIAIVQARFQSTRLPGKIMLTLGAQSVLAEVLLRCSRVPNIDGVCCAVADGFGADIVAAEAEKVGAMVVAGPQDDVLERYRRAAEVAQADVVLRITSDCPLIDPDVAAAVIAERARTDADYCANNAPPTFPHGLDCEVFTRAALERSAREASAGEDREHVSPYMAREPGFRRATHRDAERLYAKQRWTLDFPEDYAFLYNVYRRLEGRRPPWDRVASMVAADRALARINASRSVR